jgi:hypothetical protein
MAKARQIKLSSTAQRAALSLVGGTGAVALSGIRVFDVGQGDCIGLLDQSRRVFCYVDYGGLGEHPDRGVTGANPSASRMPHQRNGSSVLIILTHWDKDHYYSAKKYNRLTVACPWVVPRQMASPQAVRFAASLPNARCWPESIKQQTREFRVDATTSVEVRKCQVFIAGAKTEDRNHTGIAVALLRYDKGKVSRYMLLPGDCPFDRIPNLPDAPLQALVAYHHGAHTHWGGSSAFITYRATHHQMVYSFGANNPYGHPDPKNYLTEWDSSSRRTPDLRGGPGYIDFTWE